MGGVMRYMPTFTIRNLPTVGEYTIPYMDGMGFFETTGSPQAHGDRRRSRIAIFCKIVRLRDVSRPKRLMIVWKLNKTTAVGMIP